MTRNYLLFLLSIVSRYTRWISINQPTHSLPLFAVVPSCCLPPTFAPSSPYCYVLSCWRRRRCLQTNPVLFIFGASSLPPSANCAKRRRRSEKQGMLAENFILHAIAAAGAGGQNVIFSRALHSTLTISLGGDFWPFPQIFQSVNSRRLRQ